LDTLSKTFGSLRFDGTFYFATNFQDDWSVEVPRYKNVAHFHYVTQGACWVRVEGVDEPKLLSSGDIIVIPHGARHILSRTEDRLPISLDEAFAQTNYNNQGAFQIGDSGSSQATQLVCGHFEFTELFKHPFLTHLPSYIVKRENDGLDFSWMKDTLKFLSYTATTQHDGISAIIKRLSEVIFIQVVRFWNTHKNPNKGFLGALNDQHLSNGLRAFHEDYAAHWTVEKLARESNMSRSLFADRFKQYLDLSPMQYVTNWRMQVAKQKFSESDLSLDNIAGEVDYDSAPTISKAFKCMFGHNPGEFRKQVG